MRACASTRQPPADPTARARVLRPQAAASASVRSHVATPRSIAVYLSSLSVSLTRASCSRNLWLLHSGHLCRTATSLDRHTTGAPRTQQLEPRLDVSHWPGGGQTEAARRTRHGKPWTSHHCHQPQNGEARDRRLPAPRTATHFILSCGRLPSRTGAQLSKRPSYATSRSSHSRRSLSCLPVPLHPLTHRSPRPHSYIPRRRRCLPIPCSRGSSLASRRGLRSPRKRNKHKRPPLLFVVDLCVSRYGVG